MFTDELRRNVWNRIRQRDLLQFAQLLPQTLLVQAASLAGLPPGQGPLNLCTLAWLAVACAFHKTENFAGVLCLTLKTLHDAGQWDGKPSPTLVRKRKPKQRHGHGGRQAKSKGGARRRPLRSKHDPRGGDPNLVSEEAFTQARRMLPPSYWVALILLLGRCFEKEHGPLVRWRGYRLLTLDGTTINLPSWKALADSYGTASNGKGRRSVQARLVMLQFPLVRMPWRYELTTLKEGERTVAARLLKNLEPMDLLLADRGFWSYGLFQQIQQRGAYFGIRLMQGVKLKTVRRLGRQERLVSWRPSDRQWKQAGLPASMMLRVIDYQIAGFRPNAIVTNVLDARAIVRADWVRLSTCTQPGRKLDPGLYHRRWEIETTFFELKVEQEMEGRLRGRTAETIAYEVAGQVLLYLLVRWLMVKAAVAEGLDPLRLSFKGALRELAAMNQTLMTADPRRIASELLPLLLERIASHRVPWRPGRHDPRPGDGRIKNKGYGKHQLPSKLL